MTREEAFRELERIRYLVSIESFARRDTSEAFGIALNAIMEQLKSNTASHEDYATLSNGSPIWYVNFEESQVEKGTISSIYFKDGNIETFSVNFENGDFDEFVGEAMGRSFFASKEAADVAFVKGEVNCADKTQVLIDDVWNDTTKSTPKDTGEYLCIVEYDFDQRHEITKRLLYWDGQSWSRMGRDTDVVTYWQDSIDKPTDERCSGCLWPIQWCKCGVK